MHCIVFLVALAVTASLSQAQNSSSSPALVIHLFRHGARAPLITTYANGWNDSELSLLTPVGQREHYLLGRALADQYPDLLGQSYEPSKVYPRAATQERIIESLQSQLDGVYETSPSGNISALGENYPPKLAFPPFESPDIEQINQELDNSEAIPGGYTPIATNFTSDEGGVTLLDPVQVCFNLVDDIIDNVADDKSIQFWEDLAPTRQTLENAGLSVRTPFDLASLGDAMVCDYYANKTLPGNIDPQSEVYLNTTFARNWYLVQALYGSEQQRQLLSVPLYNYILKYFDEKVAGTTDYQFMFLSAAETNVIGLLATLNILTADCMMENYRAELAGQPIPNQNCNYTEFAAGILLEFYNDNGTQSVVFKYNNVAIPLCNGQIQCPYNDFKSLIRQSTNNHTPDDYQRDCLGKSIPELQSVLQRAAEAVPAKANGGKNNFQDIADEIKSEFDWNGNGEDADIFNGIDDHLHQTVGDIKNNIRNIFGRNDNN